MFYQKNRHTRPYRAVRARLTRLLTGSLMIWGSLCLGGVAQAAGTITVTTTTDEFDSGPACSLREAVQTANSDTDFGGCLRSGSPPYTIDLPAGSYTLTGANGEDTNASGDLDLSASMAIVGTGAAHTIIQAGPSPGTGVDRLFQVVAAVEVQISGVTVRHGQTEPNGNGGGIANIGGGTLTLTNVTVADNLAGAEGGGLWNSATGTLTVDKTTISGNTADGITPLGDEGGGGIFNAGGSLILSNSTISSNTARDPGGGLNNQGSATLINVTIYENWADSGAGGVDNSGSLTLSNSIVASLLGLGPDCSGVTAGEFNLDSDGTCQAALTDDPLLGPLQNNGGSTQTHALSPDSPARNAGNNAVCATAPINNKDQRGIFRPFGAACDLGAQENGSVLFLPIVLKL